MAPNETSSLETVSVSSRPIRWLAAVAGLSAGAAVAVYAAFFGGMPIVADPRPWGLFGDFLGGLLTPLLGLLLLVGLLWALEQLRRELSLTRGLLERALDGRAETAPGVVVRDLHRTIELIHEDLKEQLGARVCMERKGDSLLLGDPVLAGQPGAKSLSLAQLLRDAVQDPVLRETLGKEYRAGLIQVAELLQMLARYIHEYESAPEGGSCGGYLRRRYAVCALSLQKLGLLPEKIASYYRDNKNGKSRTPASD